MRFLLFLVALVAAGAFAQPLPPEVDSALARARLPRDAVSLLVADVDPTVPPRLSHRADVPVNPASIAKLATTLAALEILGPAFTWTTPVSADGPVVDGVLQGNLYLRGQGDPKLVVERLWLLLRRVRALGIDRVAGDIVLDRSAFEDAASDPAAFDGEPLRPYNAAPDALLLNYRSLVLGLSPQPGGMARLVVEPPLAGVQWPATVPLAAGDCGDWRAALKLDVTDPTRPRFSGAYPASCGERAWPLAYADPRGYAARAIGGMWQEVGGRLGGQVREGRVPAGLAPLFEQPSPPLAEVVREVNKYSNNVMAQQLFLTLSLQQKGLGTRDGSRAVMQTWWRERFGAELPVFDNGSGLSRSERITAAQLGKLLQYAWASPVMPELVASLPVVGTDGTLRTTRATVAAHLKSGSLRDVQGVAGYVHGPGGRRFIVVAIANHPNAGGLRPAVEALLAWAGRPR
ncbi:MAG TPA: D-alanyl-D-alanine carboxypeptidase/D-alanyl-D-alanine-endopeptidase [Ramlibacter sp.]|jgi:D-alanyl-D-alanine carboxypeptidase/D-alanyl-D-alanine-endopeptidase (penicillin-binding protein 4)|uniref:D-alanyl-D-alanine carboxypeptidase/D-alanyl-D-alanine endopeptidase n=1 Tax=Ramlibacter sp. TaxID=1917967 RepID=UPI002D6BBED2|nr:D-alanyl-D-alanine carboxypeptidase/D-alanyl-D-alanine-endopeptidase [Ramlibacter sp.]HZY17083.1 D-alanyl-D-alanine carboxypeptidase/D-alanyl-D-alanine-endopeptidase [Ramlibacter sp.]